MTTFIARGLTAATLCVMLCGTGAAVDLGSISNADASAGLKQALGQGVDTAVNQLGKTDGFLSNPQVKIDLPPKLAKVESMMRMVGQGREVDELVAAMNHAAEDAVPESKVLLKQGAAPDERR